ncbi:MAG: hypothetical protein HY558_08555 [Euryarchaeota archaeon]|nr:hypothetical protein [Euryarchaeota archaeon]
MSARHPSLRLLRMGPGELRRRSRIPLRVHPTQGAVVSNFARSLYGELRENNQRGRPTRWILPVGPVLQYPLLRGLILHGGESCRDLHIFHMDEYCDARGRWVPRGHPMSFRGYMERVLYGPLQRGRVGFRPGQVHYPDPGRPGSIRQAMADAGGVDTCYGGIGVRGHLAFNEPCGGSLKALRNSTVRVVALNPDTIVINAIGGAGGCLGAVPPRAVTLGMREILGARRIRLYASGVGWQRYIVRVACLRRPTVEHPVTLMQDHPDVELHVDRGTLEPIQMGPT